MPSTTHQTRVALAACDFVAPAGSEYVGSQYGWPPLCALQMPTVPSVTKLCRGSIEVADAEALYDVLRAPRTG